MSNKVYYKKPGSDNNRTAGNSAASAKVTATGDPVVSGTAYASPNPPKKEKKYRALNVVIVAMTVILFFMIIGLVASTSPRTNTYYEKSSASDLIRRMNYSGYFRLMESKYENEALGYTADKEPELKVPYAISDYFEAAFCYRGYAGANDPDADKYIKAMDQAKAEMGEYEYIADEINEYIGIK